MVEISEAETFSWAYYISHGIDIVFYSNYKENQNMPHVVMCHQREMKIDLFRMQGNVKPPGMEAGKVGMF